MSVLTGMAHCSGPNELTDNVSGLVLAPTAGDHRPVHQHFPGHHVHQAAGIVHMGDWPPPDTTFCYNKRLQQTTVDGCNDMRPTDGGCSSTRRFLGTLALWSLIYYIFYFFGYEAICINV